jgi:hypothetical protein
VATHVAVVHAVASQTVLKPAFLKVLSTKSFLYGTCVTDALESHPLVRQWLPRTIALYGKYTAQHDDAPVLGTWTIHTMACCIANPVTATCIRTNVQTVLTYNPKARDALGDALFRHINSTCLELEEKLATQEASRQARETFRRRLTILCCLLRVAAVEMLPT